MKILGTLGLDWKIFLIQVLNFLILFLILKWLFFKDFVAALKKEKIRAEEIQKGKDLIEKQKLTLQEVKKKELAEAQKKAKHMITKAGEVAEKIEKKAKKQAEKEIKTYVELAKRKQELEEFATKKRITEEIKQTARADFQKVLPKIIPKESRKILNDAFFQDLISQLKKLPLDIEDKLKDVIEEWEKNAKFSNAKERQKLLEEFLLSELGQIKIWYADALTKEQKESLAEIINNKIGINLNIAAEKDQTLLVGFRLEINGVIVESNLWQSIDYGFKQSKK